MADDMIDKHAALEAARLVIPIMLTLAALFAVVAAAVLLVAITPMPWRIAVGIVGLAAFVWAIGYVQLRKS